jgi:Domain of unknown function (DUF4129)
MAILVLTITGFGLAVRRLREPSGNMLAGAMHAVVRRTLAFAIALTMLVCVVAIGGREPLRGTSEDSAGGRGAPEEVKRLVLPRRGPLPPEVFVVYPDEEPATPAWLPWTIVGLAVAGVVTAGLLLVRDLRLGGLRQRRRRRARRASPGSAPAEESIAATEDDTEVVRRAVEAALEPLRDPADPRAAVIAAYVRMERMLDARELGRQTPEAPREYLARVLREQGMPGRSLMTLTALFEEARFSLHPIPQSAPRRALGELENTRVALSAWDEHDPISS